MTTNIFEYDLEDYFTHKKGAILWFSVKNFDYEMYEKIVSDIIQVYIY